MSHLPRPARALLLENIDPEAVTTLESWGFTVQTSANAMTSAELIEALAGVSVLGIRSRTNVDEQVLAAHPPLVAIGAFCVGTNQIDLPGACRRGIGVFNAPYSNTRSVVELAVADMITLNRKMAQRSAELHAGRWNKSSAGCHEVRGKTLGIVGYGNIGTQLSVLAESLGMRVVFYDIADRLALGNARSCTSLDELLAESDVVSVHVDGRTENEGLFGSAQFAAMKPGALFMNLSRGFVMDDVALAEAVRSEHLGGAALDVYPVEPKGKSEEFVSPLRGLPNVILTPHIGAATHEAQRDIGRFVAGKLTDYVTTGATSGAVNFPQLVLPELTGSHRIVHIHRNQPGVLAAINNVLAGNKVNIDAQYLGTRGEVGYVITDIAAALDAGARADLEQLPETLRVRVLS